MRSLTFTRRRGAPRRPEEQIQALLDREFDRILETCNALTTLKELARNGVILDTKIRQIEPPSKMPRTQKQRKRRHLKFNCMVQPNHKTQIAHLRPRLH